MGHFTSLVKHTFNKFLLEHKRLLIGIIIFFFVLITANYLFEKYTSDIVGPMLKELIASKSAGLYNADFDNMGYVLNSGVFYVDNFNLTIDSATFRSNQIGSKPGNIFFTSKVPRLYIQVSELWAIYLKRELHVRGIETSHPAIHILKLRNDTTTTKKKIDIDNLYELISDYLTVFELNDFTIKNGSLKFHVPNGANHENYEINDISINIKNFLLDQKASQNKSKFFYTDNVEVEIRNQFIYLPDSLHKISFDRFFISTVIKSMEIDNLIVQERPRLEEDATIKSHLNRMYFSIPALRFSGIDFIKAYNDMALHISKAHIDRPVIKLVTARKEKNNIEYDNNKKQAFKMPYLISIDTFEFENAKVDLTLRSMRNSSHGIIDQISFFAKNITLDSSRVPGHFFTLTYEDMSMDIADGKFIFGDKHNNLEFDSLTAYSNPTNIRLTNLNYTTKNSKRAERTQNGLSTKSDSSVNVTSPEIQISDFDLQTLLNGDTLKLSDILIDKPNVFLCTKSSPKDNKTKPLNLSQFIDPYSFLKGSLNAAFVRNIMLHESQINIVKCINSFTPVLTVNALNLHVSNISIDSLSHNTVNDMGAENWFAGCSSLNYNFPDNAGQLIAREIDFNSSTGDFNAVEFNLSPKIAESDSIQSSQLPDVQVREIKLTGIDLNNFLETNIASADVLSIESLELKMSLHDSGDDQKKKETKANNNLIKGIELNKLIVHSGKADVKRNDRSLFSTNNFNFKLDKVAFHQGNEKRKSFDLNGIDLNLDNYSIFLQKINHQLTAEHLGLHSNSKTAIVTNLRLSPASKKPGKNIYDVNIPALRMTNFDVTQLLFDSIYSCSTVLISEPHIHLEINEKDKKQIAKKPSKNKSLQNPLSMIHTGEVKLVNGDIKLQKNQKDNTQIIEAQNINFKLSNVNVDSLGVISKDKLLYARNIELLADYISLFQPEKQKFMNLNHVSFSTSDHLLEGSGLYYSNNTGNVLKDRDKFKVDIDGFKITNINILNILNDHYIELGDIFLTHPNIVLEKMTKYDKPVKKKQKRYVYPLDSTIVRSINVSSLSIKGGKTSLITKDSLGPSHELYIGDINISVKGINMMPKKLNSISTNSFVKSFDLDIGNVRFDLPDKLNRIQIGEISLNSIDTSLIISDFELIPKVGKYEFGPAKGFQSTWIRLKNKKVTFNNLQINKLLFENKLFTSSIVVDSLQMFLFRDKRVPFKEIYKPLPQEQLQSIAMGLKLDTVIVNDANIVFQQFAEKSKVPGEIYITGLNGRIINVANDSVTLLHNPKMFLEARGGFAEKGDINLQVAFDLLDTNQVFYMGAIVANLDLREFNRMLSPTVFVKIKSGYDKNLILSAKANNDYSYGDMKFYYNDLKISLLNKETETPKGMGNALGSFFANSFFIKTNNPNLLSVRKGEVFFERYKYKSIFNYWVKIFLSGVVTSIGAKSNKRQIEKIQNAQMKKYDPITAPD